MSELSLVADGKELRRWRRYEVDSDMLIPADAWSLAVDGFTKEDRELLQPGASIQLMMDGWLQLTGIVDQVDQARDRGSRTLDVSGRDLAAPLVDSAAPPSSFHGKTLFYAAQQLCAPWHIGQVSEDATERLRAAGTTGTGSASTFTLNAGKAKHEDWVVQPGETVWSFLERGAARAGVAMWMSPSGQLVFGRPHYDQQPLYRLVHLEQGATNVLHARRHRSIAGRPSELKAIASGGRSGDKWKLSLVLHDEELEQRGIYRPQRHQFAEAGTAKELRQVAQQSMNERIWEADELEYTVRDHSLDGLIWQPNTLVEVKDEVHGVDGVWYLVGRKFTHSREEGKRTQLRLRKPGIWLP